MYIRQFGGMNFEVGFDAPPASLAMVELDVDGRAVPDDETNERRTARKAIRALYPRVDALERTFVLRGFDAGGRQVATLERKFILR